MSDLREPPISISLPVQTWRQIIGVLTETTGFPARVTFPLISALEQGLQVWQRPMPQVPLNRPNYPPQGYGPLPTEAGDSRLSRENSG